MSDTAPFRLSNLQYNTRPLSERGLTDERVRTGVRQGDATCVSCGHQWTARAGATGLLNTISGVHLECPRCEARGTVPSTAFL